MKYDAVVFDLDGTLLDTLEDLRSSVNHALREFGFPERSLEEIRTFVGNGVRNLMLKAVPGGADEARFEDV
ncbi:MAG: HAD hydrolase-like protein, partial [Mailhella sp.]|nr:HAD hydrolase-like protein [Mailhella sp.]